MLQPENKQTDPQGAAGFAAQQKIRLLWQPGDLFHNFSRYPQLPDAPKIDRLAAVLSKGLVAPAASGDGAVISDLRIYVFGTAISYDSVVFLHRFGPYSEHHIIDAPGNFSVFVDPATETLKPENMGSNWQVLCPGEVYVRDRIPLEKITGIAVHPSEAGGILREFGELFRRNAIPLYLNNGTVFWPSHDKRL